MIGFPGIFSMIASIQLLQRRGAKPCFRGSVHMDEYKSASIVVKSGWSIGSRATTEAVL